MPKKVFLNVLVDPTTRELIKIVSIKQKITMAALLEQIILEWQKAHLETK